MSLDQVTAEFRASLIRPGSVNYNFNIIVQPDSYYGLAQLNFYLEHLDLTQLKIDFSGFLIEEIVVNSRKVMPQTTENFMILPKALLQKGRNKLSAMYVNKYDKDRRGCMTFQVEGDQYVYTKFQPYGAHKVFPCFDQPDIKAKMKISVVADPQWTIASNLAPMMTQKFHSESYKQNVKFSQSQSNDLLETFLSKVSVETKMTIFDYTEPLSTYLYAFAAGPYGWIDSPQGSGSVPMRLYSARSSLFILDSYSSFIFDVVQKAMTFFESFFNEKYPFKKYDQIFVRDFQSSAMQNAALVAFRQQRFLIAYSTEDDYYTFANTMVHELSHHWFGNLVTMKWWDDLWLNESFADFIAQFALGRINSSLIHPLQPAGMYFRNRKSWGYEEDQRNTATHPIRAEVKDTDVAVSIFDGITYSKGAATLKQLMFLVGENNFSRALQSYFDRFKWSNATITDLLQDLEPYFPSEVSVADWRNTWIQSPSLNVFESIWDPTDFASTSTLRLYQSPFSSDYNTLRWHKIQVAFFNESGKLVETLQSLVPPGNLHEITYDGSNAVKAILVNDNDQDFIENYIDPQSLQFFLKNINLITETQNRALIWFNISQLNKQALMRLDDYIPFLESKLFNQPQNFIINQILTDLLVFLNGYLSADELLVQSTIIFDSLYREIQDMGITDTDRLQVLYRHFVRYAQSDQQVLKLRDWIMGDDPTIQTRQIFDDNLPWEIIKKIFSVSDSTLTIEQKEQVFTAMSLKDPSSRATTARKICDIILCSQTEFDQIYTSFTLPFDDYNSRYLKIQGWRNKYHLDWVNAYKDRYFADLVTLSTSLSFAFFQFFYQMLKPMTTDYAYQIGKYNLVLQQLKKDANMTAHVVVISKMVDDLQLYLDNSAFNSQSNLTLSQDRAIDRYSYIRDGSISYISHIGFVSLSQSQQFTGLTEITFELTSVPKMLPIDFICNQLYELIVNGFNVAPLFQGEFLFIPRVYLEVGVNRVAIRYSADFSNDGYGCLSYIDTSVSPPQYYTYTHFEPYSAHKVFPCFDQPDLKGQLSLNVIVPADWVAVSNQIAGYQADYSQVDYIAKSPEMADKELITQFLINKTGKFSIFNQTEKLPTYLYCLAAGQYYSVELDQIQRYNNIPMKVYALTSYKDALDANAAFFFKITKAAIEYYESKFNIPYPYTKYDSIFCHQYAIGAMENPGLITFNDAVYLFQDTASVKENVMLAQVIAHECAHNWFGDLVTMKWFDDTWLKESFADFMAYSCIEAIKDQISPDYASGWIGGVKRAVGGYREDQLSTTHPVRSVVPNTNLAKMYFDGITYRKGMMTLKQLFFIMGETNFYKGVTDYFTNFRWGNGTIDDFLGSMQPYYQAPDPGYTLDVWKDMWLLSSSLNVLSVTWSPNNTSPNSTMTITQTNYTPDYKLLRYHLLNIAFFKADGTFTSQKYLINNKAQTVITYDGSVGVKAVLINEAHEDYVKVIIDNTSLTFFQQNINNISSVDPSQAALVRMVIWVYMNEMVRDGRSKVLPYKDIILGSISNQAEDSIYDYELDFLNQSTGSYIPMGSRGNVRTEIFDFVMQELTNLTGKKTLKKKESKVYQKANRLYYGSRMLPKGYEEHKKEQKLTDQQDRIKILQDKLISFCSSLAQIDTLNQWRLGTYDPLIPFPITNSQAWEVVKLVYTSSNYDSTQRLDVYSDQNQKDPGLAAQLALNTCISLDATDVDILDILYDTFRQMEESIAVKGSYAEGWNSGVHLEVLVNRYKAKIFQDLPTMSKILSLSHFQFFYTSLAPIDDDLAGTVALYEAVNLPGTEMIGHMNNIRKIIDGFKLRQTLYTINS